MADVRDNEQGGQVIQFPTSRRTPPPLPKLPHANPIPGYRQPTSMFGSALTVRFDREAA